MITEIDALTQKLVKNVADSSAVGVWRQKRLKKHRCHFALGQRWQQPTHTDTHTCIPDYKCKDHIKTKLKSSGFLRFQVRCSHYPGDAADTLFMSSITSGMSCSVDLDTEDLPTHTYTLVNMSAVTQSLILSSLLTLLSLMWGRSLEMSLFGQSSPEAVNHDLKKHTHIYTHSDVWRHCLY